MSSFRRTVYWQRLGTSGSEYCSLSHDTDGWRLDGTVIRIAETLPLLARYTIRCDARWQTRTVHIETAMGAKMQMLDVSVDDQQRWWMKGNELIALRGCYDVDLGVTPATNTLPIRRLDIPVGAVAAVTAAWIRFPDLHIEPLPQHYTRLNALRYCYESGAFTTEITVDEHGLATHYAGGWERVSFSDDADNVDHEDGGLSPTTARNGRL